MGKVKRKSNGIQPAQFLHGTNEVNYEHFKCRTCGEDSEFGVKICLSCNNEIQDLQRKGFTREEAADLFAMYQWGVVNGKDNGWILANLSHDMYGLLTRQQGFTLRSKGYRKIMDKWRERTSV